MCGCLQNQCWNISYPALFPRQGGPRLRQTQTYPAEFGRVVARHHMTTMDNSWATEVVRSWEHAGLEDVRAFLIKERAAGRSAKEAKKARTSPPPSSKAVNRQLSFAESEVPLIETPPHRIKPKASTEDVSQEKLKAPSVLKRAQTVDGTGTSVRKAEALQRQKELEEELEEERSRQAAEAKALTDMEPKGATKAATGQQHYQKGKSSMSTLYEDFVATGGNWKNGVIMKSIRRKRSSGSHACRKWLTRRQMLQYFDNDQKLVDSIIVRKESDPELLKSECRDHPECPGLTQYLVLVEDTEMAAESVEIDDLFQAEDSSASSSDESSKSDASSSSEDGEDEEKEAARKIGLEAKKVLNMLSSKIKALNRRSHNLKEALAKDLEQSAKKLMNARAKLQQAVDADKDDMITEKTLHAKTALDEAEHTLHLKKPKGSK
ncbi:unnamed protein product [Symbiodinium sp. CCMP2456]|nr:unnamed protein product [Symbiodinium sp. CCMP2456]